MKKLAFIFSLLAVCGFMAGACGDDNGNGGPTCQDPPATCDPPACEVGVTICCGTTCQAAEVCDPPACEAGVSYCDTCTGDCVDLPAACDPPECEPDVTYCDDGTCKTIPTPPVCEPVCVLPQICVE